MGVVKDQACVGAGVRLRVEDGIVSTPVGGCARHGPGAGDAGAEERETQKEEKSILKGVAHGLSLHHEGRDADMKATMQT